MTDLGGGEDDWRGLRARPPESPPLPTRAGLRASAVGLIALTGLAAAAVFSSAPHAAPTAASKARTTTTVAATAPVPAPSATSSPGPERATPMNAAVPQVAAAHGSNVAVTTPAAPATSPPVTTPPCPTGSPTVAAPTLSSHQDAPLGGGFVDGMWHTTVTGKITNHATATVYVAGVSVLLHDSQAGIPVPSGGVTASQSNGQPVPIAPGATVTWSTVGDVVTLARPSVTSVALGSWAWTDPAYADCP